jgi:hypothetical protein
MEILIIITVVIWAVIISSAVNYELFNNEENDRWL